MQLRDDYEELEHSLTMGLNNLMQEQLEEIRKIQDKLRKIEDANEVDTTAVKQQITVLIDLKNELKEQILALNERIDSAEGEIGRASWRERVSSPV